MSQTNNTAKAHAYILVEVWDREITNKQFSSFEEAQNELKKTFSSIIDDNNSNEYELGDNWASTKTIGEWVEVRKNEPEKYNALSEELRSAITICEQLLAEGVVSND